MNVKKNLLMKTSRKLPINEHKRNLRFDESLEHLL